MARSPVEDVLGSAFGFVIIGLSLMLAMVVTPLFLLAGATYVAVRLYLENPRRLERLARAETMILYNHALAGQVRLSPEEIDVALSRSWPPDIPDALAFQLLQVGRALFADEGLAPDIPPVPALCNTVEGARYRDLLARLGQARSDHVMV